MMKDGTQVLSGVNTSHVGKQISTKAVGSGHLHDITSNYKFPEGSLAERAAVLGMSRGHGAFVSLVTPSLNSGRRVWYSMVYCGW